MSCIFALIYDALEVKGVQGDIIPKQGLSQIAERTRRGRLEKARRGEFIPWAYHCYGYRYPLKRPGCPPQVVIEPAEAEVVRHLYRTLVEEQLTCRQITKGLNESRTMTPLGKNQVWQPATVRNILTNRLSRWTSLLQLSSSCRAEISQDRGKSIALPQNRTQLPTRHRVGLERSPCDYLR